MARIIPSGGDNGATYNDSYEEDGDAIQFEHVALPGIESAHPAFSTINSQIMQEVQTERATQAEEASPPAADRNPAGIEFLGAESRETLLGAPAEVQ